MPDYPPRIKESNVIYETDNDYCVLSELSLRDLLRLDAVELANEYIFEPNAHRAAAEDIKQLADNVVAFTRAYGYLSDLGHEGLLDNAWSVVEDAMIDYLTAMHDTANRLKTAGEVKTWSQVPEELLGLDTITLGQMNNPKGLTRDQVEFVTVCRKWWEKELTTPLTEKEMQ